MCLSRARFASRDAGQTADDDQRLAQLGSEIKAPIAERTLVLVRLAIDATPPDGRAQRILGHAATYADQHRPIVAVGRAIEHRLNPGNIAAQAHNPTFALMARTSSASSTSS